MEKLYLAGFIAVTIMGCVTDPESDDSTLSLSFPLAVGNSWTYQCVWKLGDSTVDSSMRFTTITAMETDSAGNDLFEFKDSTGDLVSYDYYVRKSDGLYLYASTPGGSHVLYKSGVRPEASIRAFPELWVPFEVTSLTRSVIWTLTGGGEASRSQRFTGQQDVTTSAGTFTCQVQEITETARAKRFHYFNSEAGLVMKEEVQDSFSVVDAQLQVRYLRSVRRSTLVSLRLMPRE